MAKNIEWISVSRYAEKWGISRNNVYKAVRVGRLGSRQIGKVLHVNGDTDLAEDREQEGNISGVAEPVADAGLSSDASGVDVTGDPRLALQLMRIEKLRADTELQRQKIERKKEEMLLEFSGLVVEAYQESFAPFKNDLISLRLNPEQIRTLGEVLERCTGNFIRRLKNLKEKADNAG